MRWPAGSIEEVFYFYLISGSSLHSRPRFWHRIGLALGLGLVLESATLKAASSKRSYDLGFNVGGLITEKEEESLHVQPNLQTLTRGQVA